jgi:hypothetical protein
MSNYTLHSQYPTPKSSPWRSANAPKNFRRTEAYTARFIASPDLPRAPRGANIVSKLNSKLSLYLNPCHVLPRALETPGTVSFFITNKGTY